MKESEARALRRDNERLKQEVAELRARLGGADHGEPAPTEASHGGWGDMDMEVIYREVVRRAQSDPGVLKLLTSKPELRVTITRKTIEMDESTLQGRCAMLISEGWFDSTQTGHGTFIELKRRGATIAKPSVYGALDKIAGLGFLTKESDGYKAVEGMKVNVVEA